VKLAGVTLHDFLKIGLLASLFIILLKFAVTKVPAPQGLVSAVGTI
jgi:hypothetical protein